NQSVLQAIARVARVDDGAMEKSGVSRREACGFVVLQRLRDPHRLRRAPRPIETWRTGDDAVEILGEALCLLHRLPAARGTAVPVRESGRASGVTRDDLLRRDRHFVNGAPAEVDDLLRMPGRPGRTSADVSGVGGAR